MNFPIQIGLPQIFLFIVVLVSIYLIILFIRSFFAAEERIEKLEDEYGNSYRRRLRRRHVRWTHGTGGFFLFLFAVLLLWVSFAVQSYLGLTGKIKVAHIHATQIQDAGPIPMMSVELVQYDQNGNTSSDKTYLLKGDLWTISGDILEFPSWMNFFGIHSGYKLTLLEGQYSDPNLEANEKHTVIVLNGGDDNFFKDVAKQAWDSPFVTAGYRNGSSVPADGMGYNICASQDGITPVPDNKSC